MAQVFVDATEFGDVLGASGVNFVQGVEVPNEDSWTVDSTCGQVTAVFANQIDSAMPFLLQL